MYEVIPFKTFVSGATTLGSSIGPSPHVLSMLDGGLTFFLGTGAVLLGLIALEKMGLTINETTIRFLGWSGIAVAALWFVLKNPLFRSLVIGF
jgi:hypothetical protein